MPLQCGICHYSAVYVFTVRYVPLQQCGRGGTFGPNFFLPAGLQFNLRGYVPHVCAFPFRAYTIVIHGDDGADDNATVVFIDG